MPFNYDKLYGETPDALGAPTPVFTEFFDACDRTGARVLDIGCGQGRDALFIARRGHHVTGVDISANGIRDLRQAAAREDLPIIGIVADLTQYRPEGLFDVLLIDRTLHMPPKAQRVPAFTRLLDQVAPLGWLLLADEPANLPMFKVALETHAGPWTDRLQRGGILFSQRACPAQGRLRGERYGV